MRVPLVGPSQWRILGPINCNETRLFSNLAPRKFGEAGGGIPPVPKKFDFGIALLTMRLRPR
jgi:hypothetical protein